MNFVQFFHSSAQFFHSSAQFFHSSAQFSGGLDAKVLFLSEMSLHLYRFSYAMMLATA